jgi:catechol 2,3-dioxygenase-like lactoylglutathione lyase family enzyme
VIDHISSYATDYAATKAFYEAVLGRLGHEMQAEMAFDEDPDLPGRRACAFGPPGRTTFWVIEALEASSPRHIAFAAADREAVAAFHAAGLEAGGTDLGAPGLRPIYHEHYFGAFLTDPDGNNVEAVCHTPASE